MKGHGTLSATFKRKTDAKLWACSQEAAMHEGRYFPSSKENQRTLGELIKRYIDEVLPTKEKSYSIQYSQLQYWKAQLGNRISAEISAKDIAQVRNELGKTRSNATVVRYLAVLSHLFNVAIKEWDWATTNPVASVKKPKEPRGRVRFLSEDERARLLEACAEDSNRYIYPVVILALSTGMRRGEILNLKWSDVDFNRAWVTIQETKNGERRGVPLAGAALGAMRDHNQVRRLDSDYVFPMKHSSTKPTDIRRAWERARLAAELKDFRFHDLRHSAASYLAMNGASPSEIADILGHKSLQMVKRYAHISNEHRRSVVESMNNKIMGGL